MRRFSLKLIRQKGDYDCVLCSVAMCMNVEPEDIRPHIKHDPEQVLWPTRGHPNHHRGIQLEDLLPIIYKFRYCCMPFFRAIEVNGTELKIEGAIPISGNVGILMFSDISHVVAWNGYQVYDPRGYIATEVNAQWDEFWMFREMV